MENRAVDKFPHTDRERGYVSAYRQGHKVSSLEVSSHVETVVLLTKVSGENA